MSTELAKRETFELSFPWARLTATGLVQTRKPTFDEWSATFQVLSHMDKCIQWAIGDAILIGDREFGEMASQMYDRDTVNNYVRVAEKFPPTLRKVGLSFSHHLIVAALEPGECEHFLNRAATEGLSVHELRRELGLGAHVGHNSGNNEWFTPAEYVEAAREVMGWIDLDPASNEVANRVVKAKRYYSAQDDGLSKRWDGNVFMNPPYAQPLIQQFCDKFVEHVAAGHIKTGVTLTNNATETEWFQTLAKAAQAICFPDRRIRFWRREGDNATPLQGQAICYFGPLAKAFETRFSQIGLVTTVPQIVDAAQAA